MRNKGVSFAPGGIVLNFHAMIVFQTGLFRSAKQRKGDRDEWNMQILNKSVYKNKGLS